MQIGQPFIINLACTGVIPTRAMTLHVPLLARSALRTRLGLPL